MPEDKTEEASEKKIQDARMEGNVPKSQDVSAIFTLLVGFLLFLLLLGFMSERIFSLYRFVIDLATSKEDLTIPGFYKITLRLAYEFLLCVLPLCIGVAIAGILGNTLQFGFIFTLKAIMPKLSKLNPIKGLKNIISLKKLFDLVKILAKVSAIAFIMWYLFAGFISELPKLLQTSLASELDWLWRKAIQVFAIVLLLFIGFAFFDLLMVRFQYFKGLRMSKKEVKDEYKQMEGDPLVKGKIRQLQMQMAKKRMMAEVPQADVVITNPTHYAVALRYDREKDAAPRVIAKGADLTALRIKQIAREHDIVVVERPELARELFRVVDLGQQIPVTLFAAVAEVLGMVLRERKEKL